MKKFLFGMIVAAAAASTGVALAADSATDIWKYNKGITFGFITHQGLEDMDSEIPFQYDSSF